MYKRLRVIFSATIIIALASCATINVRHLETNGDKPKSGGIYYALPKKVVTVEVTLNKTYKVKGPYSAYAQKYLGLSNIITENSTTYDLAGIAMNSYSIPDPDQYYFVEVPKGCHKNNSVFLQLSESGIVSSINDYSDHKTYIKSDSSLHQTAEELVEPSSQSFINSNLAESFDTIIEKVNLDTTIIEKKVLKKIFVEKTVEQKAKEAADFIMQVKEGKFNILTGFNEVNYSKESMEYMSSQLDKMEKEYLNLFTGITVTHQLKYYFNYDPSVTAGIINLPLFRFSPKEGIVDTSSFYGDNVYLKIEKYNSTKALANFNEWKTNPKQKKHGYYYRIPEYAKVSLIYNDKVKAESNLLIDQFGAVCELPANKKLKAAFYPNSGSLKSITLRKSFHHFHHH
jgi:hypothetical protein